MTREEAIKALERIDNYVGIHYINGVEEAYINPHLKKAVKVALAALTPPTQEQMERVWPGCDNCTAGDGEFRVYCDKWGTDDYCGHCGRPLTPEAWEEMRKRWEALKDGKSD
jgi:hypothetical protein|nr:MAG TPA: DNA-directed RNA polymerase [Caudoviricetes sp.]